MGCMNRLHSLLASLLVGLAGPAVEASVPVYWDGNAAVLPHEMNPPWTLVTSGNVVAYRNTDSGYPAAFLISTQAVDNVVFEQRGASLDMTNHLIIEAVVRVAGGTTGVPERAPAGITFTTEPNVGGSIWMGLGSLFVIAAGNGVGGTTNVPTADLFHTYRIEVEGTASGSPYTVYHDGVAVLNGTLFESPALFGAQPRIAWGELASEAYGESHWYSIRHNAGASVVSLTDPPQFQACTNTSVPPLPQASGPFMNLTSEGRITDGTSFHYSNLGLIFNTDDGVIYTGTPSGYSPMDSGSRRTFTQADGSQIMLFEFTDLTISGTTARITGSRAAAILATGDIRLVNGAHIEVDAAGDPGAPVDNEFSAGFDAVAPLGGGGGRGTASGYNAGDPPFLVPGKLPTSGPGGGGFVSRGTDGVPAEPVRMWKYNGPPTFDFTLLGVLFRRGGEGGAAYDNFSVLRGGGGGGSSAGTGFAANRGIPGGHGGGALLLSAAGHVVIDGKSTVSVEGQTIVAFLSEIAAGGAGGYLVINADQGILNQGSLSARGGTGRKTRGGNPPVSPWWGSCGDGSGGLIVLKSAVGVTNSGALNISGGGGATPCGAGSLQPQTPQFIDVPPQLLNPVLANAQFGFDLLVATNRLYEIQRNDDLNTTNWVTATNVVGGGIPISLLFPAEGVAQRFYRVLAH